MWVRKPTPISSILTGNWEEMVRCADQSSAQLSQAARMGLRAYRIVTTFGWIAPLTPQGMTKLEFSELLRDPAQLVGVDIVSLSQQADRYPYSANAHLLLALAAELNGHPGRERFFQRAATTTFDRAHLYDLLQDVTNPDFTPATPEEEEEMGTFSLEDLMAPEVLALDAEVLYGPPSERKQAIQSQPEQQLEATNYNAADHSPEEAPAPVEEHTPADATAIGVDTTAKSPEMDQAPVRQLSGAGGEPQSIETQAAVAEAYVPPATPQDPADFVTRAPISTREELRARLESIRQRQVEEAKASKKSVKKIARRSLVASDGLISATLAEVFIKQGQFHNAIRIYEQLALVNPEKRPIFAALIQDLKHNNAPEL